MTILSDWLEKKTSNKTYLMSVGMVVTGMLASQGVNHYKQMGDHPTELAKVAASMEKAGSLAQEQIRMFPVHYSRLRTMLLQGKTEEARKYGRDFFDHVLNVRSQLPATMQFGIEKSAKVDGIQVNFYQALDALEPALASKDQGKIETAVMNLYVALAENKQFDITDEVEQLPTMGR